jgi:uncharacterized coiled-coil protein SlyX
MNPSNSDGLTANDADSLLRAIAQLRERMRLQETELDNLRTTTRFLHQMNERDPLNGGSGVFSVDPSILDRISRLEARSVDQASTVQQILAVLTRTDSNLLRVIAELDRLLSAPVAFRSVQEVAPEVTPQADGAASGEIESPVEPAVVTADVNPFPPPPPADFEALDDEEQEAPRTGWKGSILGIIVIIGLLVGTVFVIRHARRVAALGADASAASVFSPMERARLFENDKKYADAEVVYRDILKRDPQNADAIRHLASVLFRENKIEESSVVLKQLVVTGGDQ